MKSRIFSNKYIKTALKSQPWIPIFIAVGLVLAFPVAELVKLGQWEGMKYTTKQMEILYENLWRDGFVITGTVTAAAAAFINALSSFWYLYSRRKTDFYHCLPMNRKQMFWQRAFTGFVFYIIPYAVMEFFTVCLGASRGFFSLGLMGMAVKLMVFHLLSYFLVYFCTVLVVSMTGNVLMGILCLLGLMLYCPLVGYILEGYSELFYDNSYFAAKDGILHLFKDYFSPLCVHDRLFEMYREGNAGIPMFLGIIFAVVLAGAAAFFAFEKRPAEKAGQALVYSWSEPVIRLMTAIPAGLIVGIFAYVAPTGGNGTVWAVLGSVFGIVVVHGLLETFYHFDFRCFFNKKLQLVLSVVFVAAVAFIFKEDLTGYDAYIPSYDKIEAIGVSFQGMNMYETDWDVYKADNGKYEEFYEPGKFIIVEKTQKMYELLGEISSQETEPGEESRDYYLPIEYTTGFGRKIYREYKIDSRQCKELMEEIYRDKKFISWKYGFLDMEEKYAENFTLSKGTYEDDEIKQSDRSALLQNLREDIKEADAKTFTELPCALLAYEYGPLPTAENPSRVTPGKNPEIYCSGNVYIYPGFKRTVAFLKEKGYSLFDKADTLEYADVYYVKEDPEENIMDTVTVRYEDEEQLKELQNAIVPEMLAPAWIEKETQQVEISYKGEDPAYGGFASILKDRVPDFILEDGTKVQEGLLESNVVL